MKIKTRLLSQMLSQTLFIMLITLGVTAYLTKTALETAATEKLTVMLEDRYNALNRWAETLHSEVTILAVSPTTTALLRQLSDEFRDLGANAQTILQQSYPPNEKDYLAAKNNALLNAYDSVHQNTVRFFMRRHDAYNWNDMYLIDTKGNVVFSLKHEADFATNLRTGVWQNTGLAKAVLPLLENPVSGQLSFANFSKYEAKKMQPAGFIAMPVFDFEKHQFLGVVAIQLPITQVNDLVLDKTGMGETGEVIIVGKDGWMLSDSRLSKESTILTQKIDTVSSQTVLSGKTETLVAPDYRGIEILAAVKPFYPFQQFSNNQIIWGVIAKIESSEVLSEYEQLQRILLVIASCLILLTVISSVWSGRAIAKPLTAISAALSQLAKGEKVSVPELQRNDEIGEIAKAAETFHVMTQQIEHEHWLHENVSQLTSTVSAENSIEQAANKVLHLLCNLLAIPVGAIYLQAEKSIYQRVTTHGLARSNQSEISFETGVGLLGQCVKSNQAIVLSPVPSGLTIISTGLAEFSPHELIIYPVPHKNEVLAVIELAATQSLTTNQYELLKAVSDALGLHFANLQAAEHNAQLLQETKAQAAKLSASSHYARSLIEASLDPLVTISIDGMIMDVNGATEKVTGVRREELIGSDFCQYFTDPEDASRGYQQVFAQGFVTDYPLALRHVSGKITDVVYNASLYYDANGDVAGIFAAARDVTDKKIAEQKMFEQQEALQHSNAELQAMTEELRGQSEEMRSQNEELRSSQEELRAQQEETLLKNQLLETQSKQLEEYITEAKAKAEELKRSNQYKSEFLANMSHELRTPLNSILILSKSLAENDEHNLSDDQIESANVISESGTQLLTLINDILDLSKIEAGKLELSKELFPISDMVTYLRRVFLPQSERKKLDFEIEIASDIPETIYTDKQRLTQVLTNLLTNAIKFTDLGSVKVSFNKVGENLKIAVTDTGIGIPAEKLEHIFGAFQQLDGSTSRKYGGSGLGLAISRNLAQLLGGEISVTSTVGEGSEFVIELKNLFSNISQRASDKKVTTLPTTKTVVAPQAKESTQDKNILLIEDDTRLLAILGRMITALGFNPISVESAEKGLEELEKNQITGIFLDLGLPKMSGMELLKHLKAGKKTAHIPVFIMSGSDDTGQAKTLGALGFLKKPVTRDTIIESLKIMVQHSSQDTKSLPTPKKGREKASEILLIEDNAVDKKNVLQLLSDDFLKITAVETAQAALESLKNQHFDMVILDLKLPDMSGFELLDKAKTQGELPAIVVYSARELTENEVFELKGVTESIVTKNALNERLREEVLYLLKHPHANFSAVPDSLTGKKILLVDDDARNLFALTKVLKTKGFVIEVAPDSLKALELLQQTAFDILLTDIMMPDVDGYELIRRVRALGYDKLPIIAITAKAMKGDDSLCLEAGANNYLAKPVDVNALIQMIHELL